MLSPLTYTSSHLQQEVVCLLAAQFQKAGALLYPRPSSRQALRKLARLSQPIHLAKKHISSSPSSLLLGLQCEPCTIDINTPSFVQVRVMSKLLQARITGTARVNESNDLAQFFSLLHFEKLESDYQTSRTPVEAPQ